MSLKVQQQQKKTSKFFEIDALCTWDLEVLQNLGKFWILNVRNIQQFW